MKDILYLYNRRKFLRDLCNIRKIVRLFVAVKIDKCWKLREVNDYRGTRSNIYATWRDRNFVPRKYVRGIRHQKYSTAHWACASSLDKNFVFPENLFAGWGNYCIAAHWVRATSPERNLSKSVNILRRNCRYFDILEKLRLILITLSRNEIKTVRIR